MQRCFLLLDVRCSPASASVFPFFVQYPAAFCEARSKPPLLSAGSSVTPLSFCTVRLQKSQTLDIVNCTLLFFCFVLFAVFFFIGDFIKVIFHCLSLERLSLLSSIRSDKSDINGFGSRLQERKNKIWKYKCWLDPFLHLFISFSSQVSLNGNIWNHLNERMNPNGWNQTGQTVTSKQGFLKNVCKVTFSCPLEEVFNALGSLYSKSFLCPRPLNTSVLQQEIKGWPRWRVTLDQIHNILLGASCDSP